jgi:diguanylate cyclase (GGDEF)-like protein/putative nucleotidyltransferase with HDIG domain
MSQNLFPLIAKRIDSIPTLPLTLYALREATTAEDAAALDVTRFVESDPALTAKVLRVINSPFYGLRCKISTLSHAIAMLGLPAIRKLAEGIAIFGEVHSDITKLDKLRWWQNSLAVAASARSIAAEVGYDLPEEAFIAGLLHDVGKLLIDVFAPDEYVRVLAVAGGDPTLVPAEERGTFGMDHAQLGALVAEQWNLPKILRDAIQFHHEPPERVSGFPLKHRELVGIVSAAEKLCRARGFGVEESSEAPEDPVSVGGEGSLTGDQVERVLDDIQGEFDRVANSLGFETGAPDTFLVRLGRANAAAAEHIGPRPRTEHHDRLSRVVGIVQHARSSDGVEEMIGSALENLRRALAFDRVLFFQVDLEEERLHGKYLFDDTRIDVDAHDIHLPLNPDGLIGTALKDGAAQLVDNWATDGDLLRFLGVVEVAAAPIVVNQRPLGLVCADYFFVNREVSVDDVALLGILGTDLGLAVENLALGRQAAKLRSLAAKDELTGVNNRRNLMKLLQKEIERAKRYGSPLSAVMVDIDHFKTFNDTYGHQAGDTVLREVAQLITAASRDIDIIGRYGGEEFMVALPETHVDQAIIYAERLRASVEHFGKQSHQNFPRCPLTISVGVTALVRESDGIEQVVRRVDHALYAAKERGRNRVCVD